MRRPARAAAGAGASSTPAASAPATAEGRNCPFCGHRVPSEATVCGHCGAFHGYSDRNGPPEAGKLLGWAIGLLLLTKLCWWAAQVESFKSWRACAVYLRGKRWWRRL